MQDQLFYTCKVKGPAPWRRGGQRTGLCLSVISYYTAQISRDLIIAGHQQVTREWWDKQLHQFTPYISEIVLARPRKIIDKINYNLGIRSTTLCTPEELMEEY